MTKRERKEKFLKEAEEFLEKLGVHEIINTFLESEECKEIIRGEYEKLSLGIIAFEDSAPPEIKFKTEKILKEFTGHLDCFENDVAENLKIRTHLNFILLAEPLIEDCKENFKNNLSTEKGKQALIKDVTKISRLASKKLMSSFLEILYDDYIPEEVVAFIKMIGMGNIN